LADTAGDMLSTWAAWSCPVEAGKSKAQSKGPLAERGIFDCAFLLFQNVEFAKAEHE
jgi:hypothetical protein